MLLTGGYHPLYRSGDSADEYKAKLNRLNHFDFPSNLSGLAHNFFSRLTKFTSVHRYSPSEALRHPYITRRNDTNIPLTVPERLSNYETENILKRKMIASFFVSIVKHHNESP